MASHLFFMKRSWYDEGKGSADDGPYDQNMEAIEMTEKRGDTEKCRRIFKAPKVYAFI